ncbi:carbon-nitrogen hydrolase family protein [Aminobacter sp. MSH1]|uniref:carbon-nitrogen hydrolase family protein n=1 Tax=Aminobacter sp. MSH1 TaxID=374606 RepID=UPI000D3656D3|nr:carbon-nitrogen hydrolase family protein [Aminobacter sp. MSH1]
MTKVALAQVTPVFLDKVRTVDKALGVIAEAAAHGAELVVFPETWIPCYPLWVQGAAGWDDPVVKRSFARLQQNAVEVPGPEVERLARCARENGITVVMGMNERDVQYSRGTVYNALLTISHEGKVLGVHRKLIPTHGERLFWGLGDGSDIEVYETPFGRLGGAICWEHWMPLHRFAMHSLGEQIHVAAFPDLPAFHHLAAKSYAFEGRTFVLGIGAYMTLSDVPADFEMRPFLEARGTEELLCGGSGVIGPDGEWVVEPVFGREEIIYADIDLRRIAEEQLALDTVGHYNRPDIFQLRVMSQKKPHVVWTNDFSPRADVTESGEEK